MLGVVGVITDILQDVLQGQPGLRGGRDDLVGRQQEPRPAGVPQLKGKRVLDAWIVGPVDAPPAGLVCRRHIDLGIC